MYDGTMMVVDMCTLKIAWGVMLDSCRGQSIIGPSDWGGGHSIEIALI